MKAIDPQPSTPAAPQGLELSARLRGLIAAQAMAKALKEDHQRWGLPLLTWKDGNVVAVKV